MGYYYVPVERLDGAGRGWCRPESWPWSAGPGRRGCGWRAPGRPGGGCRSGMAAAGVSVAGGRARPWTPGSARAVVPVTVSRYSPVAGQAIHPHLPARQSSRANPDPGWSSSPVVRGMASPGRASVRFDPQPGVHDLEFQRYRAGAGAVPCRVRDQLGHEQDGGLLQVSQPPGGQHVAGHLPRQPRRQANLLGQPYRQAAAASAAGAAGLARSGRGTRDRSCVWSLIA